MPDENDCRARTCTKIAVTVSMEVEPCMLGTRDFWRVFDAVMKAARAGVASNRQAAGRSAEPDYVSAWEATVEYGAEKAKPEPAARGRRR